MRLVYEKYLHKSNVWISQIECVDFTFECVDFTFPIEFYHGMLYNELGDYNGIDSKVFLQICGFNWRKNTG